MDLACWNGIVNFSASALSCKNGLPTVMSVLNSEAMQMV